MPTTVPIGAPVYAKKNKFKLEWCIDDERQFKTAKRSQAPDNATVRKRFSAITSLFFVTDHKE